MQSSERKSRSPRRAASLHIADVAALAGVSIATVSRALTNPKRVSASTRERVLEVVRRTGYTPNLAARSLRAARSMMVLVVVPSFITPFFSTLLVGVDRALAARGYGLLVGSHDGGRRDSQLVNLLLAGGADGVILLDGRPLPAPTIPTVTVSVPAADASTPAVLVEEEEGGAAAARHLLALGHRRLGYVTGPRGYIDDARWRGFSTALAAAGINPTDVTRYPGNFHAPTGTRAAERFLATPGNERPTAVFAASDMMAIAFIRTLHAAGLRVPRDLSVIGYDGIELADLCEPPLTTIRQPREAMGHEAAELLVRLIRGEAISLAARTLRLPITLRPGGSTTSPPA
jgi:LacI family repressor for deo operon, udp, cdd, tsx, nupC, and nupG